MKPSEKLEAAMREIIPELRRKMSAAAGQPVAFVLVTQVGMDGGYIGNCGEDSTRHMLQDALAGLKKPKEPVQ